MPAKRKRPPRRTSEIRVLRTKLRAAEDVIQAIGSGEVDALIAPRGERVITLAGADLAYDILFEQMNEGAVTLTRDGIVAYCNGRLAEIVRAPVRRIIGAPLKRFVAPTDAARFEEMQRGGLTGNARGDLTFRAADKTIVPVAVSFAPLHADPAAEAIGVVGVIQDITDRKVAENERARLGAMVMTAQEEERRRIARELHDEIGQSLTAVLVGLRTIEGADSLRRSVELSQGLRETTARTLADVGRLWRGLHPGVLEDLGFAAAVERFAQEFARSHGITVDVHAAGLEPDGLSFAVQATAYRIVQEALNNVAQHAHASSVTVRLQRSGATLQVSVEDDGAGFKPRDTGRLGLRGMRERAALLGGSLEVRSRLGKGTSLIAQFPVVPE